MTNVFTYGSLMFEPVWQAVVGRACPAEAACVSGFQRLRMRGESYPVALPATSEHQISGRLYCNLGRRDLLRLDRFEGRAYRRLQVSACLNAEGAEPKPAFIYVLAPGARHRVLNEPWQPEQFRQYHLLQVLREVSVLD